VPWTIGPKKAENSGTMNFSHVLASNHKKTVSRKNGLFTGAKNFDGGDF
jgi:hypothetical protein